MARVLVPKNVQSLFKFRLLYLAMGGEVAACRAMIDEIVLGEEALCASIVSGGEVDLSEKESINGVI